MTRRILEVICALVLIAPSSLWAGDGVLARCGASLGTGYFFHDPLWNPEGAEWSDDGISNGKIFLVRLGDEWDIQFGDAVGAFTYRQDGAEVLPIGQTESKLTLGAFRGTYSDVYTFDFLGKEVVWTSHKIAPLSPKVAIYHATCSFMAPLGD